LAPAALGYPVHVWGKAGRRNGEFVKPRAINVHQGEVYVVDTTGRIQVFDEDGTYVRQWSVPESKNGTPTSVSFDRQGRVYLPDTHYSRILLYTPQGELLDKWGAYGTGVDQFVYPTGVAQGPGNGASLEKRRASLTARWTWRSIARANSAWWTQATAGWSVSRPTGAF
jgi:hypothetical protein